MTKEKILNMEGVGGDHWEYDKPVRRAMDKWAKEMVRGFGDWKLSQELRYDVGYNPEYGKLSYYQLVDKFFKEIIEDETNPL